MAWDDDDKTEQPTSRRLQDARSEGQIARSADLLAASMILAGLMLLQQFGPSLMEGMLEITRSLGAPPSPHADDLTPWLFTITLRAGVLAAPFMGLLLVAGIVAGLLQTRGAFTPKKLAPNLEQLNPAKAMQRLFSTESLQRAGMGLLKVALVGAIAYASIIAQMPLVLGAATVPAIGILHLSAELVYQIALRMALLLLVLGLIDYFYQRWQWWNKLKMSKQEVKDEMKRMEGDPLLRQRRRQMQLKVALQRIGLDVPKADVIVTNPTEYAVALRYDESRMAAPRVVAKGVDLVAARIRQIAREHGVPVVQRPALARGLYAAVEVGHEIPGKFYRAVAEVLAYVYQISNRAAG